jgi:hypothetical protein
VKSTTGSTSVGGSGCGKAMPVAGSGRGSNSGSSSGAGTTGAGGAGSAEVRRAGASEIMVTGICTGSSANRPSQIPSTTAPWISSDGNRLSSEPVCTGSLPTLSKDAVACRHSLERCSVADGEAVVAARRVLQRQVALVLLRSRGCRCRHRSGSL